MDERSNTTQIDLNHALVRQISGGLSFIINFYTKTAAACALIFCAANTLRHKSHKYGLRSIRSSTNKKKGSVPFNPS